MRKTLLIIAILGLGFGLGLLPADPASAHALLRTAVPAVGATVAAGPQELRLRFSEGVEAAFSGVEVTADDGQPVTPARIAVDPADSATLIVTLPAPLAEGSYTVHWHVVSVDTHKTQGTYGFTVRP
jgi:methionine-rich copper-binding protein CopC